MKELALVGLIIFFVISCSFFAIGLAIPTFGNMEEDKQELETVLTVETTAKEAAEAKTNDLTVQLEQKQTELEALQFALDQANASNASLQANSFQLSNELEAAKEQIKGLEVQLEIAATRMAEAEAKVNNQIANSEPLKQVAEERQESSLSSNLPEPAGPLPLIVGTVLGILVSLGATKFQQKRHRNIQTSKDIALRKELRGEDRVQEQVKPLVDPVRSNGKSRHPVRIHTRVERISENRRRQNDDVNFPKTDINQLILNHWLDS